MNKVQSVIMELPHDIYKEIFSFFTSRSDYFVIFLVCKLWNQLGIRYLDPSINNNFSIRWASINGHANIVNRLLQDSRIDPSADNQYAIRWASRNGHVDIVDILLRDSRVDPRAKGQYAICYASMYGHGRVVDRLRSAIR